MKRNVKFFTIVISLLLLSAIILTGCMYAIAADNGEMKSYDLNGQKDNSETNNQEDQKEPENDAVDNDSDQNTPEGKDPSANVPDPDPGLGDIIIEDGPATQASLKAKFEAMYEISEDGKTITVISEDYLNNYWRSNYEKEVIHSLTTEEVYFIIQDSIRIYEEYDEVVLTGFASVSSMMQVAERFPFVKDKAIKTQPNVTPYYEWDDTEAIYEIILYRLKALSSPKAFFTGEEAMLSVGKEPMINSTMLPWTTFYIPNYSESTNRDYILNVVGYGSAMNSTVIEDEFSELFSFCNKNGAYINFESKSYEQSTKIFPTAEMESSQANKVVAIEDRSAGKELAWAEETFYSDEKFEYKFPALMSWYIYAILDDGTEMQLTEALQNGYIAPKDFPNFDFPYYRSYKRKDVQQTAPYFRDIAVYTDKKRSDGIFPYANFMPDKTALTQYFNNIVQNDVYVINKGTHEIPSFIEIYESYDGPWFESNSLILAVIESDSNVLPKVSSIIVDGSTVEVYFDPKSLGKKQDQVYTVFLETNKIDIEDVNIFTEQPYSEHPLYEKYPEYFGLDGMKGVEVYVWQIEDGSYRCGALIGTNRMKTNEEIQDLFENGATVEEMRTILELCEVAKDHISLIPIRNTLEDNWYEIDINDEVLLKVQTLFRGE